MQRLYPVEGGGTWCLLSDVGGRGGGGGAAAAPGAVRNVNAAACAISSDTASDHAPYTSRLAARRHTTFLGRLVTLAHAMRKVLAGQWSVALCCADMDKKQQGHRGDRMSRRFPPLDGECCCCRCCCQRLFRPAIQRSGSKMPAELPVKENGAGLPGGEKGGSYARRVWRCEAAFQTAAPPKHVWTGTMRPKLVLSVAPRCCCVRW